MESCDLPQSFPSSSHFAAFVVNHWDGDETYVEHQGHGHWCAWLDGDPKLQQATYNEENHLVEWIPRDVA